MAVDKEMDLLFKSSRSGYAEGGMAQEVDPVSGNDVPTGSLPEEVRDDIPAQLSEGEYVVPADVVRYYGVKFFEDLRSQAKSGWQELEQGGRIGGEPVAPEGMEMGGDELPFDISELQVVEAAEGGYIKGYADGGSVTNEYYTPEIAALKGPTSSFNQDSSITTRKYVGPNNEQMYVTFSGGKPLAYIPPGYKPEGEAAPAEVAQPVATSRSSDDDNGVDWSKYELPREKGIDLETATYDDYDKAITNVDDTLKGAGLLGTVAGFPIRKGEAYKLNKMLDSVNAKLDDPDAKLTKEEAAEYSALSTRIRDSLKKTEFKLGDTVMGDLLGLDGELGLKKREGKKDNLKESVWDGMLKEQEFKYKEQMPNLKGREEGKEIRGSEQAAFTTAVKNKDKQAVQHYEAINRLREKKKDFAAGKPVEGLSEQDKKQAKEEYGK